MRYRRAMGPSQKGAAAVFSPKYERRQRRLTKSTWRSLFNVCICHACRAHPPTSSAVATEVVDWTFLLISVRVNRKMSQALVFEIFLTQFFQPTMGTFTLVPIA